jgi:hypothetical protein
MPQTERYAPVALHRRPEIFGVPYAVLAAVALLILWRRSWKAHVVAALLAPLLMVGVIGVFTSALGDVDAWGTVRATLPWCLGVGYTYVGIT